jgi:hypothetical protein
MLEVLMILWLFSSLTNLELPKRYTSDLRRTKMRRNHRQKDLRSNYQSTVLRNNCSRPYCGLGTFLMENVLSSSQFRYWPKIEKIGQ